MTDHPQKPFQRKSSLLKQHKRQNTLVCTNAPKLTFTISDICKKKKNMMLHVQITLDFVLLTSGNTKLKNTKEKACSEKKKSSNFDIKALPTSYCQIKEA